ncbi:hypothetical protein SH1V18_05200 [Vallitalea longa]|uniref:Uncharacterized protein n=1 Tax=Vallitalea longa TaxID=2936439 RepID=A0A9W5Y8Q3_9FIRM|nr:beta-propeller domain-containing protein [Vallitalea longa]GKX28040.1 hypothetical protein SH1V18_05200 [Vallitalea longa]
MKKNICRIGMLLIVLVSIGSYIIINKSACVKNEVDSIKEINSFELPTIKSKKEFVRLIQDNIVYNNALHSTGNITGFNNSSDRENLIFDDDNEGMVGGDVIRIDNKYIYIVNNNILYIVATNHQKLEVITKIYLKHETNISEIFIDDDKLIIIGNRSGFHLGELPVSTKEEKTTVEYQHRYDVNRGTCYVKIYDLNNIYSPKIVKDYTFDGNYILGEIIEHNLYMVSSRYVNYYSNVILECNVNETLLPVFMDNITRQRNIVDYDEIKYFPGSIETSYLVTIGINLVTMEDGPDVDVYLDTSGNIYLSENYLCVSSYDCKNDNTTIYEFLLNNGHIKENGKR